MTEERVSQSLGKEIIASPELVSQITKDVNSITDLAKQLGTLTDKEITEVLTFFLMAGVVLNASDLHIESQEEGARIRIRIDGVLHDVLDISSELYSSLLSRVKLTSGLLLNVEDRPQDGRFSLGNPKDGLIEVRTSTLPSEHGESLVLRLLNPKNLIGIPELGLRKDLFDLFTAEIAKPNGMIIVTGPTGSGKTTTLYAFLKELQSPEIKVITIEDPIEYHLKGISQTQVSPEKGYDFASGLRAIVRQDPDAILVGEIRDGETAQIAIQAALTGHLVFSTLHTNDAAGTVARLSSMGAQAANIAPAVNLVVAQRLVRIVCKSCVVKEKITGEEYTKLSAGLKELPSDIKSGLTKTTQVARVKGCAECNNTGYEGRIGIFEAIAIQGKMEEFILTNPSISALKSEATKQGMVGMYQDGLLKVIEGITTIEEVERVSTE